MFDIKEYQDKLMNTEQAMSLVHSGDVIYIGFGSSVPFGLLDALWERRKELERIKVCTSNILLKTPIFYDPEEADFTISSCFYGPGERNARKIGRKMEYTSFHLSEIDIWCKDVVQANVCFIEATPPDENGYMSYGPTGVSVADFAVQHAERVIVQVNRNTPYITGEKALLHVSQVDAIVELDRELPLIPEADSDEITTAISNHILPLVPDGATIQLGIGNLSTAIGYGLMNKNDLGIHSELFSEPLMHLIKNGNVTNTQKGYMDGKSLFAFALGSKQLYSFMDHNDTLYGGTFKYINDVRVISQNKRMISINSAMAFDLYGQVVADNMAFTQHSAIGGQLDFVRGAQMSEGGKSIIATPSSFIKNGQRKSKIVLSFEPGSVVTTTRADVQYLATEYGCINLKSLPMQERVKAMISLAHPDFRNDLTAQAKEHHLI